MTYEEGLLFIATGIVVITWPLFYAAGWRAGWRARKESQHPFGIPPSDKPTE